jgi:hypothetical protein
MVDLVTPRLDVLAELTEEGEASAAPDGEGAAVAQMTAAIRTAAATTAAADLKEWGRPPLIGRTPPAGVGRGGVQFGGCWSRGLLGGDRRCRVVERPKPYPLGG